MDDTPDVAPEAGGPRPWQRPAILVGTLIVPVLLATGSTALAERPGPPAPETDVLRVPSIAVSLDPAPALSPGAPTSPVSSGGLATDPAAGRSTGASSPTGQDGSAPGGQLRDQIPPTAPTVRTQPAPAPRVVPVPAPVLAPDDDDDEVSDDD